MVRPFESIDPLAAVVTVATIASSAYALYLFYRVRVTLRWRPVDGEITWSMIENRGRRSGEQWRPTIKYSYTIGTRRYEGSRVYYGAAEWRGSEQTSLDLTSRYTPGQKVSVFVNPANPKEAVLERGQSAAALRWLLTAIGLVALSVYVIRYRDRA